MSDKKYIKFGYTLDRPYCNFEDLKSISITDDNVFDEIEFDDSFATLYLKNEFIFQEHELEAQYIQYAEKKLLSIFLNAYTRFSLQNFEMYLKEVYLLDSKKWCYGNDLACVKEEITIFRKIDGRVVSEEQFQAMMLKDNKDKMENIISGSNLFMTISDKDTERMFSLFRIKDPVIKYFILYSWLSELLSQKGKQAQKYVNTYIVNSKTYEKISEARKNPPNRHGSRSDGTYFTYLRNLMGHTVNEALSVIDVIDINIIAEVKIFTNWLLQILLEKLI